MEGQYNMRSPAVKRLMREAHELSEPTEQYFAHPIEDNLFEWHFTIRGPSESDFDGGIYHGRIILPPDYPMKPPSIIFLTPNGRFQCGIKICLSISKHHPESWQPSWSIRTALLAIIGFMPSPGHGAIGSLDYTSQERKLLAKKSQSFRCTECGDVTTKLLPLTSNSTEVKQEMEAYAAQLSMQGESRNTTSASSGEQPDGTKQSQTGDQSIETSNSMNSQEAAESENAEHNDATNSDTRLNDTLAEPSRVTQEATRFHANDTLEDNTGGFLDRLTYRAMVFIFVIMFLLILRRIVRSSYLQALLGDSDEL